MKELDKSHMGWKLVEGVCKTYGNNDIITVSLFNETIYVNGSYVSYAGRVLFL